MKYPWTIFAPAECCVFNKTREQWGCFSNMARGFPVQYRGLEWPSSEALYQAARFPTKPVLQEQIRTASNAFVAKQTAHAFKQYTRPDWEDVKVDVMRHVVNLKYLSNYVRLVPVLEATKDRPIVEWSTKGDQFWGATKASDCLEGYNVLGRIWEEVRDRNRIMKGAALHTPEGLLPEGNVITLERFYDVR